MQKRWTKQSDLYHGREAVGIGKTPSMALCMRISWSKRGNMTMSWIFLGMQLERVKKSPIRLGTLTVHRRNERCSKPHCNGYPRTFGSKAQEPKGVMKSLDQTVADAEHTFAESEASHHTATRRQLRGRKGRGECKSAVNHTNTT